MGECIGLDFGTTYSVVSRLDTKEGNDINPIPIDLSKDEENHITAIETLVVKSGDDTYIGYDAVAEMDSENAQSFKGFKMLLDSKIDEYEKRGYTVQDSPKRITEDFLKLLADRVKEAERDCESVDNIVVGVPNVWTEEGRDSRKYEVVSLVQKAFGASVAEFYSEPKLACAYFAHEINKKRRIPFEGYILVIDYGGGTLDVTLCKSQTINGKSEITTVCPGWGLGENTDKDGKIGHAGVLFMEEVSDRVLENNGVSRESINKSESEYISFSKAVEMAVKKHQKVLKKALKKEYFTESNEHYNESFTRNLDSLIYKGNIYAIKYSDLICAYNSVIRNPLNDVLDKAVAYMRENGIPFDDHLNGTFKIATIGGFCNFALTEKQIREDNEWLSDRSSKNDTRYTEIDEILGQKNRTLAIAHGAALRANDIISIPKQFPYTLKLYDETQRTEIVIFREGDIYEPGKPVFLEALDEIGQKTGIKLLAGGYAIPYIQREQTGRKPTGMIKPATTMPLSKKEDVYIAIAMDRNERLSLYVYSANKYDDLSKEDKQKAVNEALLGGEPIQLEHIDRLLGGFYIVGSEKNV